MSRPDYKNDPVMHYEITPNRTACGLDLPTTGFFTEDPGILEDRAGSRCKRCWRVCVRRGICDGSYERHDAEGK